MPELGADHVTVGIPILTDLKSYHALPAHHKGHHHTAFRDLPGIGEPHFMWEDWTPPQPNGAAKTRVKAFANSDPLSEAMCKDKRAASVDVDYLAEGELDRYNEEDEVTRLWLAAALKMFSAKEDESQALIQGLQKELA